jgi:hypothetical protein
MATKEEVEYFLQQLRDKLRFYEVAFRPRDKNTTTLATLDIIPRDRIDYLKNLNTENYKSGPNKDTHEPAKPDYFEFGVNIKGQEVYIKISLGLQNKMIDCMSFHIAEHPITYPFKPEKK